MEIQEINQSIQIKKSKKDIESAARDYVEKQMEEGYVYPKDQAVQLKKIAIFAEAALKAFNPHVIKELGSEKSVTALGSKIEYVSNAGARWEYDDPHYNKLKEELKSMESLMQNDDPRMRTYTTNDGEVVTLNKAFKKGGSETIKIIL